MKIKPCGFLCPSTVFVNLGGVGFKRSRGHITYPEDIFILDRKKFCISGPSQYDELIHDKKKGRIGKIYLEIIFCQIVSF